MRLSAQRLLAELISRPSVNPALVLPGDSRAGEGRVAEFLAEQALAAGLDAGFQPVLPGRANVLIQLTPSSTARRRVLLAPHMDTVGGDSEALWRPRVRGGRLHGRGACDTKGSVAAMLTALGAVARHGTRPRETEIVLAGLVDEEATQAGSRHLARSGLKAELAVVGEPTGLKVVTAHKGILWIGFETTGQAAHGSRPDCGRNAVHEMARIVNWVETDYRRRLNRKRHRVLGCGTVNVGVIEGGVQPNIVPDRCRMIVDRRTLPGERPASLLSELRSLLREKGWSPRLTFEKTADCPPLETDPRHPMVAALLRTAGQTGSCGADFFCDAALLAAGGIPSVVYGPGRIEQAHTVDEWIELRQLDEASRFLEAWLRSLP